MIKWSDVAAECGGYRDGFVAVFRRYEGQPTDEKDGQGRSVKVTATSFARHAGIDESTFRRWVRTGATPVLAPSQEPDAMHLRRARSVVRNSPSTVVDAIMEAPGERQDEIVRDLLARRRGDDRRVHDGSGPGQRTSGWDALHAVTDWALAGRGLAKHLQSSPVALNDDARDVVSGRLDEVRMTADLLDEILVGRSKGVDDIAAWLAEQSS